MYFNAERRHDAFSPFISLCDEYQKMVAKKRSKQSAGPRQSGAEESGESQVEVNPHTCFESFVFACKVVNWMFVRVASEGILLLETFTGLVPEFVSLASEEGCAVLSRYSGGSLFIIHVNIDAQSCQKRINTSKANPMVVCSF